MPPPSGSPAPRSRRSRLERRARHVARTDRDLELLKVVHLLRVVTIEELLALLADHFTREALERRVLALYDAGYLTRPAAQVERVFEKRGRPPTIYGLGPRAVAALRERGVPLPRTNLEEKAKALTLHSLEHRLLTSRALACFLAAIHRTPTLALRRVLRDGEFTTTVTIDHGLATHPVRLKPDAVLLVEETARGEVLALMLEADRSTEPKERTGLEQTSFFRKVLGYAAYYRVDAERLRRELTTETFIVLTIAPDARRAQALQDLARRSVPDSAGDLFWFTTADELTLVNPAHVLADPIWTTAAGETGSLFG